MSKVRHTIHGHTLGTLSTHELRGTTDRKLLCNQLSHVQKLFGNTTLEANISLYFISRLTEFDYSLLRLSIIIQLNL